MKRFFLFGLVLTLAAASQKASAHYILLNGRKPVQRGGSMACPVADRAQCKINVEVARDGVITVTVGLTAVENPRPGSKSDVEIANAAADILSNEGGLQIVN